jgi:hypothetical protein
MVGERGLDLAQLDAEAADLDLVVEPAQVLDLAVGPPARQIAGAVEALTRLAEGIGHEAFGREIRPAQVAAPHLDSSDAQLARDTHRNLAESGVDHMDACPGDRPTDRDSLFTRSALVVRDIHRRLGRAVEIVQLDILEPGEEPVREVRRQRLTAGDHPAQARAPLHALLLHECLQH